TLTTTADKVSSRATSLAEEGGIFETAGGTAFTLSGAVTGAGSLGKIGAGTLTLEGANAYQGNTSVLAGTLIGDADSIRGDLRNEALTVFDQADPGSFSGSITGGGILTKEGAGKLTLNTNSGRFAGNALVRAGTLEVNGSLGGDMTVIGGRLQGMGAVGSTTNGANGTIAPGNSIGTLTIDGNYTGDGGRLETEAVLGDDSSATDLLSVTGDTSGQTNVDVVALGGSGAQTMEGIKIVDVGGASKGAFNLRGDYVFDGDQAVVGGAYAYRLFKNGISDPADGDWYLRSTLMSPPEPDEPDEPDAPDEPGEPGEPENPEEPEGPLYQAGVPVYEAYAQVLQGLNGVSTLQQRVGNRYWSAAGSGMLAQGDGPGTVEAEPAPSEGGSIAVDNRGLWGRIEGMHGRFDPRRSTSSTAYDLDTWKLQTGIDGQFYESDAGMLIGGLAAHYGHASADISSVFGKGSIDTDAYGLGATLTWYGQNGFYIDGQAQASWYDSDLTSDTAGRRLADGNDGFGYAFSLETGKRIDLDRNWTLTPQAQLAYSSVDVDSFTDPFGARVALGSGDSLKGRLGLAASYQNAWQDASGKTARSSVYSIANLYYEFLDGTQTDVAGVHFASENDRSWGGIGAGGSYNWADDKYSVYGEMSVNTSLSNFTDSYSLNGTAGFKLKF
ncbi:MAG: autotransporter outer membrane beta-barrel domain-containing protein, partial [Phyllobacterium sp.]